MRSLSCRGRAAGKRLGLALIALIWVSRTTHSTALDALLIRYCGSCEGSGSTCTITYVSGSVRLGWAERTDCPTLNLGLMDCSIQRLPLHLEPVSPTPEAVPAG